MAKFIPGENDLESWCIANNSTLLNQWDYTKNSIAPNQIAKGSTKMVWWVCSKGHSFQQSPNSRVGQNQGCPYCANRKVIQGYNDFKTWCNNNSLENLLTEWDYEKNLVLPEDISFGSHKSIWWKCPYGHGWQVSLATRTSKRMQGLRGCPICAKEKNTSFPEQAIYYYVKKLFPDAMNGDREQIAPYELDIFIPTKKTAIEYDGEYWHRKSKKDEIKTNICKEVGIKLYRVKECRNHTEENIDTSADIYYYKEGNIDELNRIIIRILTQISGKSPLIEINIDNDRAYINELAITRVKENSLAKKHPELLEEWDYEKNGGLTPYMVGYGSERKVWWKCPKGHSYQQIIGSKTNMHAGCPICKNTKVIEQVNSIKHTNPDILSEWDYTKNDVTPETLTAGSHKSVWWICAKGHTYKKAVREKILKKQGCPYCSGKRAWPGFNDILTTNPELKSEWDYEKNTIEPTQIVRGSARKVWWRCQCGHSYQQIVRNKIIEGHGCPVCSNEKKVDSYIITKAKNNSIIARHPELLEEWDYDKNGIITPDSISCGSKRKVWWKCHKGHSYQQSLNARTSQKQGCPYCNNRKVLTGYNDLATIFPDILIDWNYDKNEVQPTEISAHSNKKVWWKCNKCGFEWQAVVNNRVNGTGCPQCKSSH